MDTNETTLQQTAKGLLGQSILRNSKTIREERGITIWKALERSYKRKVEDLEFQIDNLKTSQAALLDMSPTNSQSLTLAKDIDPEEFFKADHNFTMKIRTAQIEYDEAKARYAQLFVNTPAATPTTAAQN